ncbi:MAP kinase-activated protein kinase 5 [Lamellibrachia satsuma]|nr:MAP kinase-activated protein kinase 5 [Lamellibrachia satsuma]
MDGETRIPMKVHSILDDYDVTWSQKLGCGISGPVRWVWNQWPCQVGVESVALSGGCGISGPVRWVWDQWPCQVGVGSVALSGGCGISGPVRPCKDKKTGQRYALKCLIDRQRARQELRLQVRCSSHPNIVSIRDIYANEVQFPKEPEPRSRLLVVMELMDGGELFERISQQKHFTEQLAAKYTKQIALAIYRCHSLNIAHRDIKPENLLLKDNTEDAVVKLSDFGFAKVDDGTLMTPHFTPYYVAPQVLEAQQRQARERYCILPKGQPYTYDKSCDMWSLGVLIYIMLTGYPPFYSDTPTKVISRGMKKKIMAGNYEFVDEDWAHISDSAKDLVARLLLVDPEARLTILQVLDHPWLREAPNTQLLSPAIMMDKNSLAEVQQAYSETLTSMRMPDNRVTLKPIAEVNNPIMRKRMQSRRDSQDNPESEPPLKQTSTSMAIKTLRDVIAHCILKTSDGTTDDTDTLNKLLRRACDHNTDCASLTDILCRWHWDGQALGEKTDAFQLAQMLSELVQYTLHSDTSSQHS